MTIEQIKAAPNWEEKYRSLIQLGKTLPVPAADELRHWQQIHGCETNLWVKISLKSDRTLQLQAYSEARIMNGLLMILMEQVNGKSLETLTSFNITDLFSSLGIAQRLSETRLNGLKQIEQKIKELA
ncbi:cysteine desulfuration protein SufE [Pasteurella langaaensis DSM 22999]|uniref:Cysteine desulfuration protein SufE n=1 Tax=Alitibacter langaaensis DSM 22999 TaxID=1122935 RepID=A0A2U0SMU8_9PAST|nr:SufE family protein [Pasteurella langaaensis]PVX32668.1 cysteine desulfuration protein SufE [Pasteurella langaaensis DSM 22999]